MDLKNRLISYEGSIAYQTKVGYFKNGKFWTYKDSLGYPTIGYGRLLNLVNHIQTVLHQNKPKGY